MPSGGQGNFAGTMGYGGQFPGYGGSIGYTGGYGNPSSSGGGTAGQTQNSENYAGSIRPYTPGGLAGGLTLGGTWAPYPTTSSQNPDLPQNKPGVKVSGKKPPPKINPITGLPALTPAQIAAGETTPAPTPAPTGAYFDPNWSRPKGEWGYYGPGGNPFGNVGGWANQNDQFSGDEFSGSLQPAWSTPSQPHNPQMQPGGYPNRARQFGGPVAPGGQYTVGENGPETLQMGAQGGQVIPNNPVDRLGGMNPGMTQALFQLMQQRRPQMNSGQVPQPPQIPQMRPPMDQPPQARLPMGQMPPPRQMPPMPPRQMPGGQDQGGGFQLGDWRSRMGIEGLSRPPRPDMGFGGSGLGIPGVMGQMRNRMG